MSDDDIQTINRTVSAKVSTKTSNLSKAHLTRDSSGSATWAIVNSMQ